MSFSCEKECIRDRLSNLREVMKEEGIDYYFISTSDFHNSEYVSDYFKVREYFSGFTGSNGTLLIWQDGAGLWTDGRYFIQAEKELKDSTIILFRMHDEGVPTILEFLAEQMKKGQTLGFFGKVIPAKIGEELEALVQNKEGYIKFQEDIAGNLWVNRPLLPCNPVFTLEDEITGETLDTKLNWLRNKIREKNVDAIFLTKLDEIMWLFNIRGSDVECNPVALSYAYITDSKAYLFVQKNTQILNKSHLNGVFINAYEDTDIFLEKETKEKGASFSIWIDVSEINFTYLQIFENSLCRIYKSESPVALKKAQKNKIELDMMRKIFLEDSVCVTKFIYWLKHTVPNKKITEWDAQEYIDNLRKNVPEFLDFSFPTISAYGPNAAMMHYEAKKEEPYVLEEKGMLLVDSGGQYLGGTTDVTRTIVLGEISEEVKLHYSKVLEGMLSLLNAVFLKGCTGRNLDILARQPLWKMYHDYKCGTGHGVGYILNVHEGPHSIRWKYVPKVEETILEPGYVVTDEPGIYIEGSHGIRIENVLVVKEIEKNSDGIFLGFENLTFAPIDKRAIKKEYMSEEGWNAFLKYQEEVYERISPYLTKEEAIWLREETKA